MSVLGTTARLPLAPSLPIARRQLPLLAEARAIDRQTRPIYAVWELTLLCDLSCRHCSSRAGRARPDELTTAEALDLVEQLTELGVLEVTLIGGEAYLRHDWLEIVSAIRSKGMECTMVTAGRNLTLERIQSAKRAGLQSVSVSIDGTQPTHDDLRGSRSFDAAVRAMEALSREGVQVSANTQIGRRNFRELECLFDIICQRGAHSWQIQLTVPGGRAADDPSLLLEPYQLLEVYAAIARIKPRADEANIRIWPGNNLGYFGPNEAALRGNLPGCHRGCCGAGRASIGIESDGGIKACPSLPTASYLGGSIRDQRLRDIWERSEALRFTRNDRKSELWGYCKECYYAEDCLGGCSWTAHSLFGRRGNNPLCHHRVLELLARGRRERLVQVASAPGTSFDFGTFEIVEEDWPENEFARAHAIVEGKRERLQD